MAEPAVRCFVAVLLPERVARAAAAIAADLAGPPGDSGPAGRGAPVRWVPAQNLHLTLKFLGNVPRPDIPGVAAALRGAMLGERPFQVEVGGAGGLPSPARPRVITLGLLRGGEDVARLAGRVHAALAPLGFASEARPFAPHVTLGRLRDPAAGVLAEGRSGLTGRIRAAAERVAGAFLVEEFALMASRLDAGGASYRRLDTFRLGG